MKKFLVLLAALTLVFGAASQASAAVKFGATGFWQHVWTYSDKIAGATGANGSEFNFGNLDEYDNFFGYNRMRVTFSVEANEYLKGTGQFQVGQFNWGQATNGAMTTNVNGFTTRLAYLDVKFPGTPVKLTTGLVALAFPAAALGANPVMNDRAAAAVFSFPAGDVANVSLIYARPLWNDLSTNKSNNSIDLLSAMVDIKLNSFSVTPYLAYAIAGHDAGLNATVPGSAGDKGIWYYDGDADDKSTAFWIGAAFKINPMKELSIGVDAIFGAASNGTADAAETSGYMIALAADYQLSFGKPGLFAWYASGSGRDDVNNDGKFGVLPVFGTDTDVMLLRLANRGAGRHTMGQRNLISGSAVGTMGIGVRLADVKSLDKLSHTIRLGYLKGTSSPSTVPYLFQGGNNAAYGLNSDISALEIDLDNTLKIIDNLNIFLDIAYLAPSLSDKGKYGDPKTDAAYSIDLGMYFDF